MIAIDTETTGLDMRHGARPFFISVCTDNGDQEWWEWDVDPLTRQPVIPQKDVEEIKDILGVVTNWGTHDEETRERHAVIGQNIKFDVTALQSVGVKNWPWHMTRDTLLAGHVLASNQPHDLTSMVAHYLGADIAPLEKALERAVKECRRMVQQQQNRLKKERDHSPLAYWRIAREDMPDFPSAKKETWRFDYWLPRALVKWLWETSEAGIAWKDIKGPPKGIELLAIRELPGWEYHPPQVDGEDAHLWWTVLRDYANADPSMTCLLWPVMAERIRERGLWPIFMTRLESARLAYQLEDVGVTGSRSNLDMLIRQFGEEEEEAERICVNIASSYNTTDPTTGEVSPYNLQLPKGARNDSLVRFVFDVMKVPVIKTTDSGNPAFDAETLAHYTLTLPPRSKQLAFVKALMLKRKRGTAIAYMEDYQRFALPLDGQDPKTWYRLHPSFNPTGTDTLRWSSANPNSQNVGKGEALCPHCDGEGCEPCEGRGRIRSLRYCFGPAPGREWWSLDAKNIELRIPFYEAGEKELIDLFERPDDPPYYGSNHLLNFHTVYPEIWEKELREVGFEKVGPHCKKKYAATWYQWCKNGGFAKQYGAQQPKTDATFRKHGAFKLIDSRFSQLTKLTHKWIKFAEKHGYVETMPDRSVDPTKGYPLLCTRTQYGGILPTVPLSYHVQGSAMWWTLKAMIRTDALLAEWRKEGFSGFVTLQVHDELVFDFPKLGDPTKDFEAEKKANGKATFRASNLWRIRLLQAEMAKGGDDFGLPTPVGVEFHADNWGEGVTM